MDSGANAAALPDTTQRAAPGTCRQLGLFGQEAPAFDAGFAALRRTVLTRGAWVDHAPGWVRGHAALFDWLERTTAWRSAQDIMYERRVEVPRLLAALPDDGPGHPLLEGMRQALAERYAQPFVRLSMALYRDGRDSVAWHGDRVARAMQQHALVATVSLGAPRRCLLRPYGGGASIGFNLGWGDLFVMGGTCQRTWQHAIPKVRSAGPRIAIMLRSFGLE